MGQVSITAEGSEPDSVLGLFSQYDDDVEDGDGDGDGDGNGAAASGNDKGGGGISLDGESHAGLLLVGAGASGNDEGGGGLSLTSMAYEGRSLHSEHREGLSLASGCQPCATQPTSGDDGGGACSSRGAIIGVSFIREVDGGISLDGESHEGLLLVGGCQLDDPQPISGGDDESAAAATASGRGPGSVGVPKRKALSDDLRGSLEDSHVRQPLSPMTKFQTRNLKS